jgi:hypothetical protein
MSIQRLQPLFIVLLLCFFAYYFIFYLCLLSPYRKDRTGRVVTNTCQGLSLPFLSKMMHAQTCI